MKEKAWKKKKPLIKGSFFEFYVSCHRNDVFLVKISII